MSFINMEHYLQSYPKEIMYEYKRKYTAHLVSHWMPAKTPVQLWYYISKKSILSLN